MAKYYAVVNDVIGGYAVATVNKPMSEIDHRRTDEEVVADMVTAKWARHIAYLLNLEQAVLDD